MTYDIGWMMRIARTESTLLSGSISLGRRSATYVDPLGWAYAIIQGEETPLVASRASLRGAGGLHGAWGLSRRFGLLGAARASYGESFDREGANGWHSAACRS